MASVFAGRAYNTTESSEKYDSKSDQPMRDGYNYESIHVCICVYEIGARAPLPGVKAWI